MGACRSKSASLYLPHGRCDEFHRGGSADSRGRTASKVQDIYVPDLHIDTLKRGRGIFGKFGSSRSHSESRAQPINLGAAELAD
jgi:hypothetical protein